MLLIVVHVLYHHFLTSEGAHSRLAVRIKIEPKAVVHCGPGITSSIKSTHWTLVLTPPTLPPTPSTSSSSTLTPDLGVIITEALILIVPSVIGLGTQAWRLLVHRRGAYSTKARVIKEDHHSRSKDG